MVWAWSPSKATKSWWPRSCKAAIAWWAKLWSFPKGWGFWLDVFCGLEKKGLEFGHVGAVLAFWKYHRISMNIILSAAMWKLDWSWHDFKPFNKTRLRNRDTNLDALGMILAVQSDFPCLSPAQLYSLYRLLALAFGPPSDMIRSPHRRFVVFWLAWSNFDALWCHLLRSWRAGLAGLSGVEAPSVLRS